MTTHRQMIARTLQERKDRDEADRPFCAGLLKRRLIAVNLSPHDLGDVYAGRITDPAHVLPMPQVQHLMMIGAAYGHTWVRGDFAGREITQAEAAAAHVPDLTVRGNSSPYARSPAGEVWAHSSTAIWRCMPDGRLMIWLYTRPQTCAPDQMRLSEAAAIFEITYGDEGCIRIVKGRQRRAEPLSAAPAYRMWNASPLRAAAGALEDRQDRSRLPTHRIVPAHESDRAIAGRVHGTLRRSRK